MNLRVFERAGDLAAASARTIIQRLRGRSTAAVGVSGGSTPRPLYELLSAAPWSEELEEIALTWVVVDERYVPPSDPQSNSAMIERTLFASGRNERHRFLCFDTTLNDPAMTATAFEREWRNLGLETLDIVILGCGDDGHTASLFPETPVLDLEDRIASEAFVPRLDQWRVTLTMPVIRAAALRIVQATGTKKAAILRDVRDGGDHPIARATAGVETWWFVDRDAASLME